MSTEKIYSYEKEYMTKDGLKTCICHSKKMIKNTKSQFTDELINNIKEDFQNMKKKQLMKKYNLSLYYINKILKM